MRILGDWLLTFRMSVCREATPRRILVSFFVWLQAVTSVRAPLMYRPGSHRLLAAENSRRQQAGEGHRVAQLSLLSSPPVVKGGYLGK